MKRIMYLGLYWGDRYGEPPKSQAQKERDRRRVRELLKNIGKEKMFKPDEQLYDLELEICSPVFHYLMEELQKTPHLASSYIRVERIYTLEEKESAPLLQWRITNESIEDDYYGLYPSRDRKGIGDYVRRCEACGAPLEQIRDLWLNTRKMPKKGLSLTYSHEIILAPWLAQALQEAGFTGFTLRPAWHYTRPNQGEPPLYQLVVTHTLPPMASPPTEFESVQHCEVCGTTSHFLKRTHYWGKVQYYEDTDIYYTPEALAQAQDFNRTAELFGVLRVAKPYVLISQRVYRWLREHKVRGWDVVPVYVSRKEGEGR